MKSKLLYILLFVLSTTYAQNWEQIGAQQFSNTALDAGIGFDPTTSDPYIAYVDTANNNNIRVMTYDGTNWINVGNLVSSENAITPSINVNPVTNEVWVAYIRTSDNTLNAYKFNGTNWVVMGTALGNGNLINRRTRIRFNAAGNVTRISARNNVSTGQTQFHTYFSASNSWSITTATCKADDLVSDSKAYTVLTASDKDKARRWDIYSFNVDYYTINYNSTNTATSEITRISGSDNYLGFLDISNRAKVFLNTTGGQTNLISEVTGNNNGVIKLRKSSKDDNRYFIFNNASNELVLRKIHFYTNEVTNLPSSNISTSDSAFFADAEMSPNGDYYVVYKDGGKVSVKRYNVAIPLTKYYVNATATGNNDGSTWADAFTDVNYALSQTRNNDEIWIASGIYKPHSSSRSTYFDIIRSGLKIYGGFSGTETQLSDRVLGINETILSGDLQGNDSNVTDFYTNYSNSTRNTDNSVHIINITATGNNLLLDGLTISDAHNNLSATERGGAIIKDKTVAKLTLKKCIIKNNVSRNDNAGLLAEFDLNNTSGSRGKLIVENCQFVNNMSRLASGIYSFIRANTNVDITVANGLFDNNLSADLTSSVKGIGGSASWFRILGDGCNATLNLTNNTYVNNIDTGTNSVNNLNRAVVGISRLTGVSSGGIIAKVNNSIFWGNTGPGGITTRSITDFYSTPVSSLIVSNSLDPLNFNDDSIFSKVNTINSNPLFTSTTDFTLQSTSPAIDTGDSSKIPSGITTDLLNNVRIFNVTVDMGAYEYGAPLGIEDSVLLEYFKIYPNPVRNTLHIQLEEELENIEVYSILGRKVLENNNSLINVSHLASGMYLLKVYTQDGKVGVKRFIKE